MNRQGRKLTIGSLAENAGVGVETVRFYERKGLIKQPVKAVGFREYSPEAIRRIQFIKRAQELGFTLKEVKDLLQLQVTRATCATVKRKTDEKISEIEEKIKDLRRMQRTLKQISKCCEGGVVTLSACPILDCFEGKC